MIAKEALGEPDLSYNSQHLPLKIVQYINLCRAQVKFQLVKGEMAQPASSSAAESLTEAAAPVSFAQSFSFCNLIFDLEL